MKAKEVEALLQGGYGDLDLEAAVAVLNEHELPLAFALESVAELDRATNKLCDQAAKLKRSEAPRAQRLKVRKQIDALVSARSLLYRLRPAQDGDVVATPAPRSEAKP